MGVKSDRYEPKTEKIILTDDTVVFGVQEITGKFDTPAAPTGDGTMIAIQKAIRDTLAAGISVSGSLGRTWALDVGTDSVSVPGVATESTLAVLNAKFGSLGQKAMAGSAPVVVASDQGPLTVKTQDGNGYPLMVGPVGSLGIASEYPVVQANFVYGLESDVVSTTTANGGTVTAANAIALVSSGTATNGQAAINSRRIVTYRTGQAYVFRFTALFDPGVSGSLQEVGAGTASNGFFFVYSGATFGIIHRSGGVDTLIPQSTWNRDRLDGSGGTTNPSGVTIDPTKGNLYEILFTYLGFGAIRFYMTLHTGVMALVHVLEYPNANTAVMLANPNLRLRAAVTKTSGSTDVIVRTASLMGAIKGNPTPANLRFFGSGVDGVSVWVTEIPIIAILNTTTFNSIDNLSAVSLILSAASVASKKATLRLYRAPNTTGLTGGAFASPDAGSCCTVNKAATAVTITGWRLLTQVPVEANTSDQAISQHIEEGQGEIMPGEMLVVTGQASGVNATVSMGLSWQEQR